MRNVDTASALAGFKIMRPGLQMTPQHFQMNVALTKQQHFFIRLFSNYPLMILSVKPLSNIPFPFNHLLPEGRKKGFLQHLDAT